jgi:hypothetical protein
MNATTTTTRVTVKTQGRGGWALVREFGADNKEIRRFNIRSNEDMLLTANGRTGRRWSWGAMGTGYWAGN